MGLRKLDVQVLVREIISTPRNPRITVECTGMEGWKGRNPNIVRICKSVRIIERSLNMSEIITSDLAILN